MEIEKTLALDASPTQVWALLLDPAAMSTCVPGMESVEVINADEYLAVMKVKISFISARFKLKTRIVEQQAPHYLRAEGTGEDTSVASSLKQVSEMWLTEREGGGTALRMKVKVDVLGRMGTFGLGVMKTKADRIWDEFGVNLSARLMGPAQPQEVSDPAPSVHAPVVVSDRPADLTGARLSVPEAPSAPRGSTPIPAQGFWARLFCPRAANDIRVEVQRGDTRITVSWPSNAAPECVAWLRELTR